MIYFYIKSEDIQNGKDWVKKGPDKQGGENTFVTNMEGPGPHDYCLISVPDDNSPYVQAMKKQFDWSSSDPRLVAVDPPHSKAEWGQAHEPRDVANRIKMKYKDIGVL